jgi:hypothetical protein
MMLQHHFRLQRILSLVCGSVTDNLFQHEQRMNLKTSCSTFITVSYGVLGYYSFNLRRKKQALQGLEANILLQLP